MTKSLVTPANDGPADPDVQRDDTPIRISSDEDEEMHFLDAEDGNRDDASENSESQEDSTLQQLKRVRATLRVLHGETTKALTRSFRRLFFHLARHSIKPV